MPTITAPTTPPTVTSLPTAPSRSAPSTFRTLMDSFLAALVTFKTQMDTRATWSQTTAQEVYDNANFAKNYAGEDEGVEVESGRYSALHHSAEASAQRVLAQTAKTDAETAEGNAQTSETNAGVFAAAAQAAAGAPSLVGNAGKVLSVNATADGVEWSGGLSVDTSSGASQTVDFDATGLHEATLDVETVTFTFDTVAPVLEVVLVLDVQGLAYSLPSLSYDDILFDTSVQEANPRGLAFKPDGLKMYTAGNATDDVFQYTLSTAWDVSTASYDSVSEDCSSQTTTLEAMRFGDSGSKMYIMGYTEDSLFQYDLSSAWDLSTSSYASKSLDYSSETPVGGAFELSSDGTKAYVLGQDEVFQYTLSTPWDLSTGAYASKSKDCSSQGGSMDCLTFNSDGTKMFVGEGVNEVIFQYTLSTAWDVSTASYDSVSVVLTEGSSYQDIVFSADGTRVFTVDQNTDDIFSYSAVPTVVFPAELELPPLSLVAGEKMAIHIVTTDTGSSFQAVNVQGSIT